jgi:hypothetical protein
MYNRRIVTACIISNVIWLGTLSAKADNGVYNSTYENNCSSSCAGATCTTTCNGSIHIIDLPGQSFFQCVFSVKGIVVNNKFSFAAWTQNACSKYPLGSSSGPGASTVLALNDIPSKATASNGNVFWIINNAKTSIEACFVFAANGWPGPSCQMTKITSSP